MTTEFPAAPAASHAQGVLEVGQTVRVAERAFGCQLTVLAAGQAGLQVSEVGPEHIGLYDPAADVRSRLPRYLIHKEVLREQPVAPAGAA